MSYSARQQGDWHVLAGAEQVSPETVVASEGFEGGAAGSGTWIIDTTNPHTGLNDLRSAVTGNSQTTTQTFTVPSGANIIRFWYRVSSEANFDFFTVYKNSVSVANRLLRVSGTANVWTQTQFLIYGVSSIVFEYSKDSSASSGLDLAAIDDIEWIAAEVATPQHLHVNSDHELLVATSGPLDVTLDEPIAVTLDEPIDVNIVSSVEIEIKNDVGSPVPVSGTVNIGTIPEVEIKNDTGNPVPVSHITGTLVNGAETAVSSVAVQVLAANSARKKLIVQNTGNQNVRIGVSGVAATTGTRLLKDGSLVFDMPDCPTQAIFAIRETADSTVFATEIT